MPLSHSRSMSDLHSEQHDSTKPRLIPSLPPSSQFPRHSPSRRTAALSLSPLKTENLYPRNRNSNETSGFGLGVNPSFGNRYILAPRPSPPSVLNSRPSPAQLRKSFSATSSGSGGFGFGTVSSGSGSSRSPERGRTRIKATGERKRKTRREGEEDRTGRSSSGSSKEIRKFFIEGQSTDNWSAMALFSATFKRFDPNSTGSISIRDFIPLIRQIEEELPGCNKYGILQKESEKIIYNTIEKAPDLTLTEEEFIQVFDDINKDQEGILQLMEVFKNAGKFAQEDVYEDVGDPEMVVRDGPPFSAGSPPLSPCFHEDGEGNSLWHALVGPVPSSPRDRRSFAYSEGDATGMLDTPLSTSTPMAMIATNRRAFPGVTTPDRRMSSPNRPGSNPTLRSGSPRPLSRGGGPTDKSFRAGPPRMAPLRPAGDDQAVSRPSSRGRSRGGSSSSRSRRRRSLTGLAPFEIDMELALFHPNLLSLETPTTIENLRALTALDVMTIITDFRYAWAIAEQRERELKDLHTRINEVESNTVENADWDEGRIIEIQKKYEEADAAVTTVNEHNAALIQDLHRTEALYVELENDMEKLTKELEETVRVAEREKAERLKISEKLSRSQKHLARVEENGLDSLRSLDKNKEEVIKYVAKINSLQEAIKKRDEIIKEVKNDLEESNEKINVLNEELVACRANVEHLTPGVTPSQRTRTSLGAMLGGVKLDGPSDDENRWEYNSEPSASEGNGSFGSMGSMGHDTTIGEYPHGYRDKDREGYVPKPATGDRVEDEAKIQTQVSEEEEEEQSGSKSPMLRDANTQTQITSGDEPNELSSQDITTQTKLLKLQDIKEMAKQYPYRELVLDMARDYPFGQLIADLADEYPGLLTPLPPINKDDEKLSEPEDLGELSEGEDLSFSEDEPEDEEQQEEGLVNADDQKQQEQGEARDQTIIKIALPPSRKPVPKESCSSGEFPKRFDSASQTDSWPKLITGNLRGGWAGHNTGDINTGNSSDPTSGAPAGGGAAGDTGVPGGEGGGSGGSAASGALGVSGQAAAGNITRENPRWLHPHDFGMGIPKNRLPVVAGAPPRNPRTFPPADRGQTEPYEDYMQYYLGNYLSEEQRVRPGARGQDYEAYRQYYFGAYMNPPGDNSGNDLADNPRRRRDKPSGDGAYIGKFRIPAPDGEYVERISTTLETRVRLQELNTRPRLTIAEAQEVARFVDSQFNPPENVILKTIWLLAGRVERASRRAIREAEWPREERLETLIPYNNPFGILGWPWKMLWHILRSMDWADYQALASTENIALVMKNNGMIGLDVFPSTGVPPPPTGAPPPPAGASLPPTGGTTASPATPVRGKGAAGPSASGGGGPGVARTPLVDPMTGLRNTLRPYARRIPLGQAAELLQAGPRPAAAWSILSFILICGLTGLTMFNVYMYTRLKVKQRGWEDSLGVYTNRPNWYDSCYMACSGNQYQYSPPQGLLHVYERFIDYVGPLLGFDDDCVALPPT